jgi:NADH:ubiquinone oxidoreductase subunit 2 (subunit N)
MLAYSSVAHTGYALIAFATMQGVGADGALGAFSGDGLGAALFYLS